MKTFARTYWFTWGFLVLAALGTGGAASVKDAFFGGLLAAVVSAALTRPYERLGLRYAPLLGALAGAGWVLLRMLHCRWFGDAGENAAFAWQFGTQISVHAAAFAGAGLLASLRPEEHFARAVGAGVLLAVAMTAVPYGFIAWIDHRLAGPVEIVLLTGAEVPANAAPVRREGAEVAVLAPDEIALLKERFLVVDGPGGPEAIDDAGRRYWPLWRKRLSYPGNPGGPVRRVLVMLPPDVKSLDADRYPALGRGDWTFSAGEDPRGLLLVQLGADGTATTSARFGFSALTIRLKQGAETAPVVDRVRPPPTMAAAQRELLAFRGAQVCSLAVVRRSPVGDFYAPDPVRRGIAYAFDYTVVGDDLREAQPEVAPPPKQTEPPVLPPVPKTPAPERSGR
ncbi:MAG: hypothetical protein ACKO3A_02505 [Opitutia bacterium]